MKNQEAVSPNPTPFLDTQEAATYLRLSPKTLEKFRVVGGGPPYRRHGSRIIYELEDLKTWSRRRRRTSTSDPGPEAQQSA